MYAQTLKNTGFFIKVKTVLPSLYLLGPSRFLPVSGGHCRDRILVQKSPKWQDRGIIPDHRLHPLEME